MAFYLYSIILSVVYQQAFIKTAVQEFDDTHFHFIFKFGIVMDLMTVARVEFGRYVMSGIREPVGCFIYASSILAYRILVTGNIVYRKLYRDFGSPFRSGDILHHFQEVEPSSV